MNKTILLLAITVLFILPIVSPIVCTNPVHLHPEIETSSTDGSTTIELIDPKEGGFYLNRRLLFNGLRITTMLGWMGRNWRIKATDPAGIKRIEMNLDGSEAAYIFPPKPGGIYCGIFTRFSHYRGIYLLNITAYNNLNEITVKSFRLRVYYGLIC